MLNTQLNLQKISNISRTNALSSGFTLIELLVVIVILAILAVAVIVAINPAQRIAASDNARTKSDLSSFGSSAGVYAADYGTYPPAFGKTGFDPITNAAAAAAWNVASGLIDGSGNPYAYYAIPNATCASATPTAACTDIAISGHVAANDTATFIAGSNNVAITVVPGEFWCYRSATGQITLSNSAAASGTYAPGTATAPSTLTGANCVP